MGAEERCPVVVMCVFKATPIAAFIPLSPLGSYPLQPRYRDDAERDEPLITFRNLNDPDEKTLSHMRKFASKRCYRIQTGSRIAFSVCLAIQPHLDAARPRIVTSLRTLLCAITLASLEYSVQALQICDLHHSTVE
jgi:hypothetical protein